MHLLSNLCWSARIKTQLNKHLIKVLVDKKIRLVDNQKTLWIHEKKFMYIQTCKKNRTVLARLGLNFHLHIWNLLTGQTIYWLTRSDNEFSCICVDSYAAFSGKRMQRWQGCGNGPKTQQLFTHTAHRWWWSTSRLTSSEQLAHILLTTTFNVTWSMRNWVFVRVCFLRGRWIGKNHVV